MPFSHLVDDRFRNYAKIPSAHLEASSSTEIGMGFLHTPLFFWSQTLSAEKHRGGNWFLKRAERTNVEEISHGKPTARSDRLASCGDCVAHSFVGLCFSAVTPLLRRCTDITSFSHGFFSPSQ